MPSGCADADESVVAAGSRSRGDHATTDVVEAGIGVGAAQAEPAHG
jgi:hypothetical protein